MSNEADALKQLHAMAALMDGRCVQEWVDETGVFAAWIAPGVEIAQTWTYDAADGLIYRTTKDLIHWFKIQMDREHRHRSRQYAMRSVVTRGLADVLHHRHPPPL